MNDETEDARSSTNFAGFTVRSTALHVLTYVIIGAASYWLVARHFGLFMAHLPEVVLQTLVYGYVLLAGGASNWIDRITRGSVVDFLNVGVGPVRTGVFNVADVAITFGVGALVLDAFRNRDSACP